MALGNLAQNDVITSQGVVRLWTAAEPAHAKKPVLLAIPGTFAPTKDIEALGESLGILGALSLIRLPTTPDTALSAGSIAAISQAVSEIVETTFAGRNVVLLGISIGAVIALGVRASNLARVIAVEPPLATAKLWPVVEPLRQHLRQTAASGAKAFCFEAYGIDLTRHLDRDYRAAMAGLDVPVEVVLGDAPLTPPRPLTRFPSFVDVEDRRWLAARPGVRMHVVPDAGHNVLGQAPRAVRDIVLEACRRASAGVEPQRRGLDEPLLEATPLVARKVLHWGPGGAAFRFAFERCNPKCEVTTLGNDAAALRLLGSDGEFDAVVLGACPSPELLPRLAAKVRPGGHLIARGLGPGDDLAPLSLALREPIDLGAPGVVRAQKLGPGDTPRPALHLKSVIYSGLLMDIRTRLPARGLRSDPDLQIAFDSAPFDLPQLPFDLPKAVVLQRPAELRPEAWRPFMARAIREGWIVVMEYDDYPPLVAEVQGRASSEADLLRFGLVHAVQTASPPLVEAFRPYNPETVLFANAAFDLLPFPEGERPRRVFYGAALRGRYAVEVAKSLGPAIARHPDAEFIVIGDPEVFKALPTTAKRYYDYMAYEAYLELLSQCAISLSPIEALRWRETKSDAKFLDASRAGVLTIASPTIYDRVIQHGMNGFLAPAVADWSPLLERALSDEPMRREVAGRAWDYVRSERMFADQVAQRRDWYWDLWSRRAALNEALMQRMPGLREAVAA